MIGSEIHIGDAREVLATLPADSVHCCVTSPPYWNLRDYGVAGQMGSEPTFEEYLGNLVAVCEEIRRVLRPDGTFWLNLGDSYAGQGGGSNGKHAGLRRWREGGRTGPKPGFKRKDLIGVPWRVAFALQDAGWWLRSDVVWHKPNAMPDSADDRPARSHEFVFLLTKSARYFYDDHAVRTQLRPKTLTTFGGQRATRGDCRDPHVRSRNFCRDVPDRRPATDASGAVLGARMRDVWTITSKPYPGAHFATFPPQLVDPCIRAGTSAHGVCPECGAPFVRVVEKGAPDLEHRAACGADSNGEYNNAATKDYASAKAQDAAATKSRILEGLRHRHTARWDPSCDCDAGHGARAIVLDPFCGVGTTGMVAAEHHQNFVGVELSARHADEARARIEDVAPLFIRSEVRR